MSNVRGFAWENMNLNDLAIGINLWAESKGWNEQEVPFAETCQLISGEVNEAFEEYRHGHAFDDVYDGKDYVENEIGHLIPKPEGIPIEFVDALIRILHWFGRHNINPGDAMRLKMEYNDLRPHRHGGLRA